MKTITYAPEAFRYLNGILCVYKPSGFVNLQIRNTILTNIAVGLNEMKTRPPKDYVKLEGSVASGKPLTVNVMPSFSDHPLVVGPRYQAQDIRCMALNYVSRDMSGVQLYAINKACGKAVGLRQKSLAQVIEVKGQFGFATDTGFPDGKVIEKSTYRHVRRDNMESVLSSIEATHRANVQEFSGVQIGSQEAYEAACKGIVRPKDRTYAFIFNMTCTEFNLPYFTLKVHCFNTTDAFLANLIPEIGIYLRSCAVCCQVRQIQYGPFTLDYALLRKHWKVEHVLNNIILCQNLITAGALPSEGFNVQNFDKSKVDEILHGIQEQARLDELHDPI